MPASPRSPAVTGPARLVPWLAPTYPAQPKRALQPIAARVAAGYGARTVEGNVLSYEQEVAKLELIVKVAQDVWG